MTAINPPSINTRRINPRTRPGLALRISVTGGPGGSALVTTALIVLVQTLFARNARRR